ncbi:MAG: hypothetical protein QMD14_01190 [Candidatus Aenigmarchaeota archaeon]|nr:hypothetical protein [Candidatus Aenigmarchaeota archaeon]
MKIKNKIAFCTILLLLTFFSPTIANALSVGSFPYSKVKTTNAGENTTFTIGFFNLEENPAIVRLVVNTSLMVKYPQGQELLLEPNKPITNPTSRGSWFYLENGKYVKIKTLSFLVYAPNVSENSTYPIEVIVSAEQKSPTFNGIAGVATQVTKYFFRLNVIGSGVPLPEKIETSPIEKNETSEKIETSPIEKTLMSNKLSKREKEGLQTNFPKNTEENVNYTFAIVVFTLTLIISLIIIVSSRY